MACSYFFFCWSSNFFDCDYICGPGKQSFIRDRDSLKSKSAICSLAYTAVLHRLTVDS